MGLPESRPFDQRYRRQQRWSAVAFYFGLLLLVSILSYFLADGRAPQERVAQDAVPAAEHKQYGNEARTVGDDRAPENRGGREAPPATRPARASARSDIEQKGGVESDLLIRNVRVF